MLVKIAEERYISTEHIRELTYLDGVCYIGFSNGELSTTSQSAFDYLKLIMEANESMITENELAAQPVQALTSRVAVILRDQFVGGATQDQIGAVLNLSLNETANELSEALAALIAETIVVAQVQDHGAPIYYHATHAPARYWTGVCSSCCVPFSFRQFDTSWSAICEGNNCWQWIVIPAVTSTPDPSDAAATPVSVPAEYSERSEVPKSDG